jgi:hypothetical protein
MPTTYKLSQLDIVTIYDPARSRESEYGHLARNAIMTTGCTPDYDILVLDYFVGRKSFDVIYDALKQQCQRFSPRCVAVEDVAVQLSIGDAFYKIAQIENFRLPSIQSIKPDTRINKKFRIKTTIQQIALRSKLFAQKHHHELRQEWEGFPNGRTIDLLDVLAYGIILHNIPDSVSYQSYNEKLKEKMLSSRGDNNVIDIREYTHRDTFDDPRYFVPKAPENQTILRYA